MPSLRPPAGLAALITNVQGFSTEDGPGIRTTVFFKGCPLRCPWCHNPEGLHPRAELIFYAQRCIGCKECLKVCRRGAPVPGGPGGEKCERCFRCVEVCPAAAREIMGKWYTVEELTAQVLRDRLYYETSNGGVTASGGEPLLWTDFLAAFFARLRKEGIHTALDTSAVIGGEKLRLVLRETDLALVDLKIMNPVRHEESIGIPLDSILKNIVEIAASGVPIALRVPIVPGYTDSPTNLRAIAEFVRRLPGPPSIDLLPYHRMALAKYQQLGFPYPLAELQPPSTEMMEQAKEIFSLARLTALIGGRE